MRKSGVMTVMALAAALAACGSRHQGGDQSRQGAGQAPEEGQGTVARDTTPFRPGQPGSTPTPPPADSPQARP